MDSNSITQLYFSNVDHPITYDRRKFLKKLGKGIIVIFSINHLSLLEGWSQNTFVEDEDFNAFLRVKEDGRVDCYTGKIEMGQGVITSLAQVLAEELEVPITSVDMIMGDTDLCPYDAGTWGSLTTRFTDPVIRAAAAEAREILISLAAEKLGEAAENLQAANGTIFVKGDKSKTITYAQLTKGKKIVKSLTRKPEIKKAKDFNIIGKPILSLDAVAKVTGKAKYSGDIKLPGMVYASIIRPKVYGSKKVSVDKSGLSQFEGAELLEDGDLVAVVHLDPEIASKASKKVKIEWKEPEAKATTETIFTYLENTITENDVFEKGGNLEEGKKSSSKLIKGKYYDGYKAHASIEPHCATCYFEGDKLIMWASSQTPFGTRAELAKTFDMPLENVHIKQIFLGGGFGGKIYNQQAVEAAKLAKLCGKPLQLVWTRKEEFMYDRFRPAAVINVTSGVNANGKLNLWDFDIYCAGTRGTNLFYDIPNNRTRLFNQNNVHPFGTGAWRAPGNSTTTFARESHIDVTAHALGVDALEFRLKNLKDQNMVATLKLAAETFGWNKEKPEGHGYGIALGKDAGTLVAIIAEVYVDTNTGEVTPIRIVCAQDMGQVVNPHGATVQTEGGVTMGIGYALYEDIEFEGGNVKTTSFNKYQINTFSHTPKIECVFIDKMDSKPQGGGEPAIICVGGAIANAVFDACGARVNLLPISPKRILESLK
ncbi:xanthine dehydrogenase family protein molybdopterin-binding subunit [Lutibacter sp. B1]|uniref:xanthine dehydrogenase family protein molybdopterin-binding subunit n=1 Tax=Lutibacter sp. B1 TaxID=2725996 RepID=UPI00145733C3|nr:molybdopterin cofactor-binding domain-containing protein [Lutibacter sp. B1]NLP59081.1 molybdopterin-dependent oxidoreductase [Lutibacter sp. B1]